MLTFKEKNLKKSLRLKFKIDHIVKEGIISIIIKHNIILFLYEICYNDAGQTPFNEFCDG